MIYFILILTGLVSALLFDVLPVRTSVRVLIIHQVNSLQIMKNSQLSDDQKQRQLLLLSGKVLIETIKISLFISLTLLPFAGLIYWEHLSLSANPLSVIVTINGILSCSMSFVIYYLSKMAYGRFR